MKRKYVPSYTDSPQLQADRVLTYLTELAQAQGVHQVGEGAILGACRISEAQWPTVAKHLTGLIEAVPSRSGYYRLPEKRNENKHLELEVMTSEDRDQLVLRLLEQGPASPRQMRGALSIEGSVVTRMMRRLAEQGLVHSTGATNSLQWHLGPSPRASVEAEMADPVEAAPVVEVRDVTILELGSELQQACDARDAAAGRAAALDTAIDDLVEARAAAEHARDQAEKARQIAEGQLALAELARDQAEKLRKAAETRLVRQQAAIGSLLVALAAQAQAMALLGRPESEA